MHIVGINIGQAAAPSGLPLVRVVFEGRGGESIAVEMARGDDADGALGAIDRAKALLVQTATFEMPVDRIGGFNRTPESGNVRGRQSNVYTFEYRDGDQSRQVPPAVMPSFEAARAEAIRCAIDSICNPATTI
ncbi:MULTISPECIES: hypothetical protein [unclassified Mesorhizobium]|uniref:hypothetical protein n=1 Tax=unclassified Mesorhizobium TaxID=325217 RepID=UPI00333AF83D